MPTRTVHSQKTSISSHESPSTPPPPNVPKYDTYSSSASLESGPPGGDSDPDSYLKHPSQENSTEESTPFLHTEDDHLRSRAPSLFSRWLTRWILPSRRNSALYRRKLDNRNRPIGINGQPLHYSLKRRPSLFRCSLYLLGATLMLL
jgi:hypothetical protein